MEDELAAKGYNTICKDIARISATAIAILSLLWTIFTGFTLTNSPDRVNLTTQYAFLFGVATIVLGVIYIVIGLAVVADLALNLSGQPQEDEKNKSTTQQEVMNGETREMKTMHKDMVRVAAILIFLFMLSWVMYTGQTLASEPRLHGRYNRLAFSVGVVTVAFGFVYLVIGIAIAADLTRHFWRHLQKKNEEEDGIHNFSNNIPS